MGLSMYCSCGEAKVQATIYYIDFSTACHGKSAELYVKKSNY